MNYRVDHAPTWEGRVFVGSVRGYDGPPVTRLEVERAVAEYQRAAPENLRGTVRVTPTTYLFGDYREDGYEVGLINYPRFPLGERDLAKFARDLAAHLLDALGQNRVGAVTSTGTWLLTREGAELHPKKKEPI